MIPVRCFTCGKIISLAWEEYRERVEGGEDAGTVLTDLGLHRYCCRRMLLTHKELVKDLNPYQ
ncbi:MAG: DNA-directed RNA polymerase subunit N [Methanomicrobiales archaeon]|nr:DNA-directed RNA polymerase subunit N [Methanomicrobiales archaeon]